MDEPTIMEPEPEAGPVYIRNNPEAGTEDELQKKIRNAYYRFKLADNCTSLLKEVLNHDVFHAYKDKKTKFGGSFWDVIQAGATYINEPIGLFAPDPEAYSVFKPLFNVALDELHLGFHENDVQPTHTWGNFKGKIRSPDPTGQYIESSRIRLCRNLVGYPFASCLTRTLLKEIEGKILPVLKEMPCGLDGRYFPMEKLRDEIQKELRQDHILWNRPSKYMKAANVGRFWPTGRGIYMNKARNFFVWVGKDDHMRIVSMSKGSNLQEVYERLVRGAMVLEDGLDFVHDDRLGYLTFDPANLGTTLRASYLIRLPRLMEVGFVEKYAEKFELEVRGTYGARLPVKDGLYNISNKRRLGLTEFEAIMGFQLGITKLILEEQKLENELKYEILEIAATVPPEMSQKDEAKKKRKKSRDKYWNAEGDILVEEKESLSTAKSSSSHLALVSSKKKEKKKEERMEKKSKSKSGGKETKSVSPGSSESASSVKTVRRKGSLGGKSEKLGSRSILQNTESLGTASSFRASVSSETTKSKRKKSTGEKSAKKSTSKHEEVTDKMSKNPSDSSTSSDSSKKKEKKGKKEKTSKKSKSKINIEKYDNASVTISSPSTLSSDSTKKKGKKSEGGKAVSKRTKNKNTDKESTSSAIFDASSTTILEDVKARVKAREKVITLDDT